MLSDVEAVIAATVLAMDIANALSAMWGDAAKLATFDWIGRVALISLVLLPAGSLALIFRGNRRGWAPLGISFAVVSVWFLYYATDWWGPVGGLLLITMASSEWEGEEDFHGAPMWWSHYGAEKNRKLVESAGFEVLFDEIDAEGDERHQLLLARRR